MSSLDRPVAAMKTNHGAPDRPVGSGGADFSGNGQIGHPPTMQWILLIICAVAPVLTLIVNGSAGSLTMNIIGFIFGTFVSVIAFAWFLIADNGERSKSYRDWSFISPRTSSTWILLIGWIFGLFNMFVISVELSRHLAGTK